MLLLDSFLNECCFKGSSMVLKVHTNTKMAPVSKVQASEKMKF